MVIQKFLKGCRFPAKRLDNPTSHHERISLPRVYIYFTTSKAFLSSGGRLTRQTKNERRIKMTELTQLTQLTLTQLTQSTSDTDELLRKVQESLGAGRIDADQAETARRMIRNHPDECDSDTLRYFEKLHALRPYLDAYGFRFTIHEFTYHFQLPDSEKQKIAAALEEALTLIKLDRELEGSK
jgi:hypothetical protein